MVANITQAIAGNVGKFLKVTAEGTVGADNEDLTGLAETDLSNITQAIAAAVGKFLKVSAEGEVIADDVDLSGCADKSLSNITQADADNAGKYLKVDTDGSIIVDIPGGGSGGDYALKGEIISSIALPTIYGDTSPDTDGTFKYGDIVIWSCGYGGTCTDPADWDTAPTANSAMYGSGKLMYMWFVGDSDNIATHRGVDLKVKAYNIYTQNNSIIISELTSVTKPWQMTSAANNFAQITVTSFNGGGKLTTYQNLTLTQALSSQNNMSWYRFRIVPASQ